MAAIYPSEPSEITPAITELKKFFFGVKQRASLRSDIRLWKLTLAGTCSRYAMAWSKRGEVTFFFFFFF